MSEVQPIQHFFALSLYACRREPNAIFTAHMASSTRATDEDSARAAGLKQAHRVWPNAEGWKYHSANALQIRL